MDRVDFTSPDGEHTPSVSLFAVLVLMRTEGESYWNSQKDTGFATLSVIRNGQEMSRLVFTMKDSYGFHMQFTDCSRPSDLLGGHIAIGSDDYDTVVEVNLSDSPIFLPQAFFISHSLAEHAVEEIFRTGTRSSKASWVPERELDWDIQKGCR